MKYPLWILNSSLFFLLLLAFFFIWFSQEKIPRRVGLEPKELPAVVIKAMPIINIVKIYEQDLFDTYTRPAEPPPAPGPILPQPPRPKPPRVLTKERPSFLEPLPIMLKGIIIVSQDDTKSMATIAGEKFPETVYKIGDIIEDAQLIRIFRNKVVFVRSNGQQEILYLREKDAKTDPVYAFLGGWEEVVEKISDTEFSIDPRLFTDRVQNLAQFIDILDLTTAYRRGKSVGCRVGALTDNSLGVALGLHSGDIVLAVNDIEATNASNRYAIYKKVIDSKINDTIIVRIQRSGQIIILSYLFEERRRPEIAFESGQIVTERAVFPGEVKEKEIKSMQERHAFAPTVEQIRLRERENILRRGRRQKQSIAE